MKKMFFLCSLLFVVFGFSASREYCTEFLALQTMQKLVNEGGLRIVEELSDDIYLDPTAGFLMGDEGIFVGDEEGFLHQIYSPSLKAVVDLVTAETTIHRGDSLRDVPYVTVSCRSCGGRILKGDPYCPLCGARQ